MKNVFYTLKQIAILIDAKLVGDADYAIDSIAPLSKAKAHQLTFLADATQPGYLAKPQNHHIETTQAGAVILTAQHRNLCPTHALIVSNPQMAFVKVAKLFAYQPQYSSGVHTTAVVARSACIDPSACIAAHVVVGERAIVGAHCVVESGCVIGDEAVLGEYCTLKPRVTIYPKVKLADRVVLHAGVVLGSDGFGNVFDEKKHWVSIPQLGSVTIGNDVEIGANTTIDCGSIEDTVIENGVKIDNQVQIGHNVLVGAHTVIAGCVGIAGSAQIGRYCMIGGGSCINGHIRLADGVILTGMSAVFNSIKQAGIYSSGTGVQKNKDWHKSVVRFKQLDTMAKRIKQLERQYRECDQHRTN